MQGIRVQKSAKPGCPLAPFPCVRPLQLRPGRGPGPFQRTQGWGPTVAFPAAAAPPAPIAASLPQRHPRRVREKLLQGPTGPEAAAASGVLASGAAMKGIDRNERKRPRTSLGVASPESALADPSVGRARGTFPAARSRPGVFSSSREYNYSWLHAGRPGREASLRRNKGNKGGNKGD